MISRPIPGRADVPERGRRFHGYFQLPESGFDPLAESLEIPKLNFQVIRRTIATRAQSLGSVKDIQSHLRHSRADTTANEYLQELPESVQEMVGTVYSMLTTTAMQQQASAGMSR